MEAVRWKNVGAGGADYSGGTFLEEFFGAENLERGTENLERGAENLERTKQNCFGAWYAGENQSSLCLDRVAVKNFC